MERRLTLALVCALLCGCGASGLAIQARVADTVGRSVNAAAVPLTAAYEAAQRAAIDEHCPSVARCDGPAARAAVDGVRSRWRLVLAAHDSLRIIHETWSQQIEACARTQSRDRCTPNVVEMAGRVLTVANTWRCALRGVGVADPIPLPLTCTGAP